MHEPGRPLDAIRQDLDELVSGDELLERACALMHSGHAGQERVGGEPFWAHPARVALALADAGTDESVVLAAALTHDLVEDTPLEVADIARELDMQVAEMVEALTVPEDPAARSEYYADLPDAPRPVRLVKVADRTDNLLSLAQLVDEEPRRASWGRSYLRRSERAIAPLAARAPGVLGERYERACRRLAAVAHA